MKRLMYVCPHLSTGGMPQYVVKLVESLQNVYELYVVEYHDITGGVFVVQKNRLRALLGDQFITLYGTEEERIRRFFHLIETQIKPDIVHLQEIPEMWMPEQMAEQFYNKYRTYTIVETSHDSGFDPKNKRYLPDSFAFISQFHPNQYKDLLDKFHIPYSIVEYPIEKQDRPDRTEALSALNLDPAYFHVLNVGLFTPRKNQAEIFDIARGFIGDKIQFHFVGNQADNFRAYWEPLMKDVPTNCKVWGERSDVDRFYAAMDLFLFTSLGQATDRETNPIVLKEALSWQMPVIMYNLPVYCGMYDDNPLIRFTKSKEQTIRLLKSMVFGIDEPEPIPEKKEEVLLRLDKFEQESNKFHFTYLGKDTRTISVSFKDMDSMACMWSFTWKDLTPNMTFWCIPIPIHSLTFSNDTYINGVVVEYYESGEKVGEDLVRLNSRKTECPVMNLTNSQPIYFNYREFFLMKIYEALPINDLGVVFDIGANIGLWTKYILGRGAKKVFCFEPNVIALEDLQYNTRRDNVVVFDKAISYKKDRFELFTDPSNSLISSFTKANDGNVREFSYKVDAITLDYVLGILHLDQVDLVKIDIEGAEFDIIQYLTEETTQKIKAFLIETHPTYFQDGMDRVFKLKGRLLQLGYHIQEGPEGSSYVYAYKTDKASSVELQHKVKLVHLQTTQNSEREIRSRESLEQVIGYGLEYKLHKNEPYVSIPPIHNCMRPECVGLEASDYNTPMGQTKLTPAHYGCFESFKIAILREFDKDLDFLILCEGDCLLEVSAEQFINTVNEVGRIMNEENIYLFSFGDTKTLDLGVPQSKVVSVPEGQKLCFVTQKIIGLQCIMFSSKCRDWLQDMCMYHPWDAADIFFNTIFAEMGMKLGILYKRITTQANGVSLIDGTFKFFSRYEA